MTCVVGYVKGSDVFMGADSWVGDAMGYAKIKGAKVRPFSISGLPRPILIGWCGALRLSTIIERMAMPPMTDDQRYWVDTAFVDALRKAMWEAGHISWNNGYETMPEPNALLIGFSGHLYRMYEGLEILEVAQPYASIGIGELHADGAFAAMENIKPSIAPKRRVELALRAAAAHSPYVAPPFTIFRTG